MGRLTDTLLFAFPICSAAPDWSLGSPFGLGGLVGMYLGAACQKHIPQRVLKGALGVLLAGLGGAYVF